MKLIEEQKKVFHRYIQESRGHWKCWKINEESCAILKVWESSTSCMNMYKHVSAYTHNFLVYKIDDVLLKSNHAGWVITSQIEGKEWYKWQSAVAVGSSCVHVFVCAMTI